MKGKKALVATKEREIKKLGELPEFIHVAIVAWLMIFGWKKEGREGGGKKHTKL